MVPVLEGKAIHELTLPQYRVRLSRQVRQEYGVSVAEFDTYYPLSAIRNEWLRAVQETVERHKTILSHAVMECLVRELGEKQVLYIYRGARFDAWPPGYNLPSVRRQETGYLYRPRMRVKL